MFRVRYAGGVPPQGGIGLLDRLAQVSLDVTWVTSQGSPALFVSTIPDQEALLVEGLRNQLPDARLRRETIEHLRLPTTLHLWSKEAPEIPLLPDLLLRLKSAGALACTWRDGQMTSLTLHTREDPSYVKQVLANCWEGARAWRIRIPAVITRLDVLPSGIFTLPSPETYVTLASRNVHEIAFQEEHGKGCLLGSDPKGNAIALPRPMRALWIGDPTRVPNVAGWMTSRFYDRSRVLVLDASSDVDKGWQDVSQASIYVSWYEPGRSTHVNPLTRLPLDSNDAYIARVMAWLAALNIGQAVLGGRTLGLLKVFIAVLVKSGVSELSPLLVHSLMVDPQRLLREYEGQAPTVLSPEELEIWRGRDFRRDSATLTAGASTLKALLEVPEMALWSPPYASSDVLLSSPWSIFRVPNSRRAQRSWWAGMWPLIGATYSRPNVLTFSYGLQRHGQHALNLATGGASVLAWGRTLLEAIGTESLPDATDLIVGADGADTNPRKFSQELGKQVTPAILASQATDQAVVRIRGDVGSVRFHIPTTEVQAASGWITSSGATLPQVVSLYGDREAAVEAVIAVIRTSVDAGDKFLILMGDRELWESLTEYVPEAFFVPQADLPTLNPLFPRNTRRWIWWARGLKLPAPVMQSAFRSGVSSLQSLLYYLKQETSHTRYDSYIAIVQNILQSSLFGENETDPADWWNHSQALAIESMHPALTRLLMAIAMEQQARVVIWNAPGVEGGDLSLLQRCRGLLYPDKVWVPDVLVAKTVDGQVAVLPPRLQELAPGLQRGEAYLWRRGTGAGFSKVRFHE